jgi:hypothetical protein
MLPGREAMSMPLTTAPRSASRSGKLAVFSRLNGPATLFPPVLRFLGPWSKECKLSDCSGAGAYSVMRVSHFPPIGWGRVGLIGGTDTTEAIARMACSSVCDFTKIANRLTRQPFSSQGIPINDRPLRQQLREPHTAIRTE